MYIPLYSRFISGTTLKHALTVSKNLKIKSVGSIIDFSVESSKKLSRNIDEIFKQIKVLDNSFIALKFSALGIENQKSCYNLLDQFYYENNKKDKPNTFLIDAEYDSIQNKINDLANYAIQEYNTEKQKVFYKTLQMYRNDIWKQYMDDMYFMKENKYAIKLVRGAYMSTDPHSVLRTKTKTDDQYNRAMIYFLDNLKDNPNNNIIIATHNKESYSLAKNYIDKLTLETEGIYFATLLGMADDICFDSSKFKKLKYVPYGPFLETTPYLFRRVVENKDILKHIF